MRWLFWAAAVHQCSAGVLTFWVQQVSRGVPATAETSRGVFGPLKFEPAHKDGEDDIEEEDDESDADADAEAEADPEPEPEEFENPRKRPVDRQHHALPNASPAKRQRLSNGHENGADSATPMDIDNNHAYPSPLEGEQAASPLPHTEGPDQGTQVDKVHELTQETVFLRLGVDEASEASPARASENPLVLLCEWNPQDPSILAAAGTDALARVWTIDARGAALESSDREGMLGHVSDAGVSRPFMNLVEPDVPKNATVSAMAWNWSGDAIAMSIDIGSKARITIWGRDGTNSHRFEGLESPVIKLRWNPNNDLILGISPEKSSSLITIFSASTGNSISHLVEAHNLDADALDATWISDTDFILCGGDTLISLRHVQGQGITPGRAFATGSEEAFSHVQFDWRGGLIATASDKGHIDIWNEAGQRRSISAHIGVITTLQWQPLQSDAPDNERLLASGGEDGAICIWNVHSSDNRPKYSMTMTHSVLALSMTPDGAFIAGATSDRVLIWKVGDHAMPRASWTRVPHPGWQSPKVPPESDEEFTPCLGWDSEGKKLVYGANSRLAVINFR
ncbi:WD40-repeat-containing domain protein [Lasiosphaeria miniovina]|uniref:WD40-repeat-containing domain protein n=1 Tax=Lasiosphaeria miniovina TaxID=1954250 RepID=A0AA39ZZM2_9PEZI|nr:WD40-repeat-containing domain protein [Lasiosphaeria miniovina]KAK0706529.1 WD40-repeat-containing domain protein [Lasiosphaeria miniovina]